MTNILFGYMGTTLKRINSDIDKLDASTSFIEIQMHDRQKRDIKGIKDFRLNSKFKGFVTIHGEGETDNRRRIKFSSSIMDEREKYVSECAYLYTAFARTLDRGKIRQLILHPDTVSSKSTRNQQIELLATSLNELADRIKEVDFICIEPRGGESQRKVLQYYIDDIRELAHTLSSFNANNIGLCIDIAQLFIVHGNIGTANFLRELKFIPLPIREFHISDVKRGSKVKNRVAMEVGTGDINWRLIFPIVLQHCNSLLIETLGGVQIFNRSKAFLESLVI